VLDFVFVRALAAVRWAEWGLLPDCYSSRLCTPNYFTFLAEKHLRPAAVRIMQTAWFALLVMTFLLNILFWIRLAGALRAELTNSPAISA